MELSNNRSTDNILASLHQRERRKSKAKEKLAKKKLKRQSSHKVSQSPFIEEAKKTIFDPKIAEENNYLQNFIKEKMKETVHSSRDSVPFKNNYVHSKRGPKRNSENPQIKFLDMLEGESSAGEELISEEVKPIWQTRNLTRPLDEQKNVFDSLEEEEELNNLREEENGIVILPDNALKKQWDYLIVGLTVFTILETPFSLAFRENNTEVNFEFYFTLVIDSLFCLDIILTFFTAYFNEEEYLVTNNWIIAKSYFCSWFFLDLFSSFPTSALIEVLSSSENKSSIASLNRLARITRPFRILKWFRIIRLAKIAQMSSKKANPSTTIQNYINKFKKPLKYALKMLALYGTFMYFLSCMWVFIGKIQIQYGYSSWLIHRNFVDKSDFDIFVDSLYFNLSTILTVGYGDMTAVTYFEYVYCIGLLGLGTSVYSYLLSKFSTVFSQFDEKTLKYHKKLGILMSIRQGYSISDKLFKQMRRAIKFDYEETFNDMNKLVETLPNNLKLNLYLEMYIKLINKLNFFKKQSYEFITFVLPLLRPVKFQRNELIVALGEYFSEFYMITMGKISVELGEQYKYFVLAWLREGHNFGDLMMYINEQSPFNFRAKAKITQMLLLSRDDFALMKQKFKKNLKTAMSNSYKFLLMIEEKHYLALEYYDSVGNLENFHYFYNQKRIKKRMKMLLKTIEKDLVDDEFVRIINQTVIDPFNKSVTKKKLEGTKHKLDLLKKRSLTNKLNIQRINTNNDSIQGNETLSAESVQMTPTKENTRNNSRSSFKMLDEPKYKETLEVLPKRARSPQKKMSVKFLEKKILTNAGIKKDSNFMYKHQGFVFCNKCAKKNKVRNAKIMKLEGETEQIKDKVKNLRENNVKEIAKFTMEKQLKRLNDIIEMVGQGKKTSKFI